MAELSRSHTQQLVIKRPYLSIRNISQRGSNGETQGTCIRVPSKASSSTFCSGKRHTAPSEHSGSKPLKRATGVCIGQSILVTSITLHDPDRKKNAPADAARPIPNLPIPSLPIPI